MIPLKLTQIGEATALILPEGVLQRLGVAVNDAVCLIEVPEGFVLAANDSKLAGQMEIGNAIMSEDRKVLKELE
ncbi:hypothetical protein [Parvibaculum sp.]|uniref:hypothetical protein n=1 Tax=Parvibaculum sp. TaxID=2024848 RepID=UPI00391B3725